MMTTTTQVDTEKVEAFVAQLLGTLTGAATTATIVAGDELGLYEAMARSGPVTPEQLAAATATHERYLREWLAQQAAAGIVDYDPEQRTFLLPPERAAVLADDSSPVAMAGAALLAAVMFRDVDSIVAAFRSGGGVGWGEHDHALYASTERFFQAAYRAGLVDTWIPALDGVADRLTAGARAADVGTGHGAALLLMAQAFPASQFVGFDAHPPSIETARRRAAEAGLSDRVRFEVAGDHDYPAADYDLITFFDALHDFGDPVGAAAYARSALRAEGTLMLVEPFAADDLATNIATNPGAALYYAASTFICTPHSLSQPVATALGAQAGEARLREVLAEAGFRSVRRVADSPLNMVLEARP